MEIPNTSTWAIDRKISNFPKLKENTEADVVIIGGGITGILSAYVLAKAGKKVIVLEADKLASGATLYTTAFVTQVLDTDPSELIKMFGLKKAKVIWNSGKIAILNLEKIIKEEKIDCEFTRCSNYIFANSEKDLEELEKQRKALSQLGLSAKLWRKASLGFKNFGALEIQNQAKFHPVKFLQQLVKSAEKQGVIFFENSKVEEIKEAKNHLQIKIGKFTVKANYSITATYDPLNNPKETFMKKGMYKSYVFEVSLPQGKILEGTYEDVKNPYHYFRIDKQEKLDRMIIGGEDHRMEIKVPEKKNFQALEKYLKTILEGTNFKIVKKWAGPILEPSDGLALIGEFKPHQLLAAAFSGNGMTYSIMSAIIFKDIILEKNNSWTDIYNPKRIPTAKQVLFKAGDYAEEFFKGAVKNLLK